MLTASEDDPDMFDAIKGGAQGYLFKNLESDEFFGLLQGSQFHARVSWSVDLKGETPTLIPGRLPHN